MNGFVWFTQVLLAGAFLYVGLSKIFANERRSKLQIERRDGHVLPGVAIGILEILAAVAVVLPMDIWPPAILPRLAAGVLALLAIPAAVYHARRQGPAAPTMALFFMALLVILERWP
jgi:DoxX-like family